MYCALEKIRCTILLGDEKIRKKRTVTNVEFGYIKVELVLVYEFNWLYRLMSAMSSSLLIFSTLVQ